MKKIKCIVLNTALALLLCFVFSACPSDATHTITIVDDFSEYEFDAENPNISVLNLTRLVEVPRTGALIQGTIEEQVRYTAAIRWFYSHPSDGVEYFPVVMATNYGTDLYQAQVTLRAKPGFVFAGIPANSLTHLYAAVTHGAVNNTATSLVIQIRFPPTPGLNDVGINSTNLGLMIRLPNKGETPAASYSFPQFTADAEWYPEGGAKLDLDDPDVEFLPLTTYRAELSLTARPGFTLIGATRDTFIHPGAKEITYNPMTFKLTLLFNPTAAPGADDPVSRYNLSDLLTTPVHYQMPMENFTGTQYSGEVNWFYNDDPGVFLDEAFTFHRPVTAVVTLDTENGFTLTGVPANAFHHADAVSTIYVPGSGIVTVSFPGAAWVLDPAIISAVPLTGEDAHAGLNIRACCMQFTATAVTARPIGNMLLDGTAFWKVAAQLTANTTVITNEASSSWLSIMHNPDVGAKFSSTEARRGHHSVFCSPGIPTAIQRRAHCITLDLGKVSAGITQIGLRRQGGTAANWPSRIEFFYSNNDIGPIFDPDDPEIFSLGLFNIGIPGADATWVNYDLFTRTGDGLPFSARYIHFRMYSNNTANETGDPDSNDMDYQLTQIRVMVLSEEE